MLVLDVAAPDPVPVDAVVAESLVGVAGGVVPLGAPVAAPGVELVAAPAGELEVKLDVEVEVEVEGGPVAPETDGVELGSEVPEVGDVDPPEPTVVGAVAPVLLVAPVPVGPAPLLGSPVDEEVFAGSVLGVGVDGAVMAITWARGPL